MPQKTNPYERVLANASLPSSGGSNALKALRSVKVIRNGDGIEGIDLIFPSDRDPSRPQIINFRCFERFPCLMEPFADALSVELSSGQTDSTRETVVRQLRNSFNEFLELDVDSNAREEFTLSDISQDQIERFVKWLNRAKSSGSGPKYSKKVRSKYLGILRRCWKWLKAGSWKSDMPPGVEIPSKVWSGIAEDTNHRQVIHLEDFSRLYQACVKEIAASVNAYRDGKAMIAMMNESRPGANFVDVPPKIALSIPEILAGLDQAFAHFIPNSSEIKSRNVTLNSSMVKSGGTDLLKAFHPTARDLVPFILVLAIHSAHNPNIILSYKFSDFTRYSLFGEERVKINPYKNRSEDYQPRSLPATDDFDNPAFIIDFLTEWTSRIRPVVDILFADRLLIFVQRAGEKRSPTSYKAKATISSDPAWQNNLKSFLKMHDLPDFSLAQIRTTVLDIVDELTEGDLRSVLMIGGQKSAQVVEDHYKSDGAIQRGSEALAHSMNLMQRDLTSRGKIDSRRIVEEKLDRGAATPGWGCLDPHDSPWPTERKGRLCRAYGRCPVCELAQLDIASPVACFRAFDLLGRVDEASLNLPPLVFHERWAEVGAALKMKWLPLFPVDVTDAAQKLDLPRIPAVE